MNVKKSPGNAHVRCGLSVIRRVHDRHGMVGKIIINNEYIHDLVSINLCNTSRSIRSEVYANPGESFPLATTTNGYSCTFL